MELATYFARCEEAELFACGELVGEDATEMCVASKKSGVRLLLRNGEEHSIGNSCVVQFAIASCCPPLEMI